jgi:predicted alpha/beta-hydrolase family hydrolase
MLHDDSIAVDANLGGRRSRMELDDAGGFHWLQIRGCLCQLACHYTAPVRVYLAHGASGGVETMEPWIEALRERNVDAHAVALPRGTAARALPVYQALLAGDAAISDAVIGGHSFGGRVASLLAAAQRVGGLVLLSYPLHRPGHPEQLRVEHWERIDCPTLLLSGEADPFARLEQLRSSMQELENAELVTYPGVGHGLRPVLEDAVNRIAEFVARVGAGAPVSE